MQEERGNSKEGMTMKMDSQRHSRTMLQIEAEAEKPDRVAFSDETTSDIKHAVEHIFGSGAVSLLYFVGKSCGQCSYLRLYAACQGKGEAAFALCAELKEQEGWGRFRCEDAGDKGGGGDNAGDRGGGWNGKKVIRVEHCFEARSHEPAKEPVCHFVRGFIEGLLGCALKKCVKVTEVECIAKGDRECVFVADIGAEETLKRNELI